MIEIKIEINFKKETDFPFEKFKIDSSISEILEFLKEFKSISIERVLKKKLTNNPDYDPEEKDLPPWGKILRRMGDNRELVEDLVGRMEQPLRSSVCSIPKSILVPYNQLAMLFKLPFSVEIKSKKGIHEYEKLTILKLLNESFCNWFNSNYEGELIAESNTFMNELNKTKLIIAEIKGTLEGSSN